MKDIRLCDDSEFEETVQKCNDNNVGIEVQAFADFIMKQIGDTDEEVESRIEKELIKESINI